MALVRQVEVYPISSVKGGMAEFYTPQSSHETMLVHVPGGTVDELFVHHFQTDQLLVVRGHFVLVVLQKCQYRYIPLSEAVPQVVKIPPGVPHGAINLSQKSCVLVNAVLRHGPAYAKDYQPLQRPFPYDMAQVNAILHDLQEQERRLSPTI